MWCVWLGLVGWGTNVPFVDIARSMGCKYHSVQLFFLVFLLTCYLSQVLIVWYMHFEGGGVWGGKRLFYLIDQGIRTNYTLLPGRRVVATVQDELVMDKLHSPFLASTQEAHTGLGVPEWDWTPYSCLARPRPAGGSYLRWPVASP